MDDIKHIVKLSSDVHSQRCEECEYSYMSETDAANHYVKEHGYRLLHVGQETSGGDQTVVIVVGTTDATNVERIGAERTAASIAQFTPDQ